MPRFLVLYSSSATVAEQMANSNPEQREAGMALWNAWYERGRDSVIDLGTPLTSVGRVPADTAATGRHLGGYSILEADSAEAAMERVRDHPHLHSPDATIEVFEMLRMPSND